jgi:phosphohistidine phosphatase
MKTVYFNRHAKSDWSHEGLRDFDRPLNHRGFRDSPTMGDRLKSRGEKIDLFISSPAKRAISTARLMAEKYGYPIKEIKEVERLYHPSIRNFIDTIAETDESLDSIILFAHNPGITEVVEYLSDEEIGNMPTCGIAKIDFPSAESWKEISAGTGNLIFFDYPKNDNPFE